MLAEIEVADPKSITLTLNGHLEEKERHLIVSVMGRGNDDLAWSTSIMFSGLMSE